MELALSDDIIEITAEINIWKQQAGQAVFEIGKRLKHVKENDLTHGQFGEWLKSLNFDSRHAHRYIQAFEQFSPTSGNLSTSKIFEMLSLPEAVDRQEFIATPHAIPSTGETKNVDDMTVKELREVKNLLRKTEDDKQRYMNEKNHFEKLWKQEKDTPAQVITQQVTVIPGDYEDLKKQSVTAQKLNTENVQLQRQIQDMKIEHQESTNRVTEINQAARKLKESFKNLLTAVSHEQYNAKFYFDQAAGSQQAYQAVEDFQQEFHEIVNTIFIEWKDRISIKSA